eukprot:g73837.t1
MSDASDLRLLDLSLLPEQGRKCILGVAASIMARTCYCPHSAPGPMLPDWHHGRRHQIGTTRPTPPDLHHVIDCPHSARGPTLPDWHHVHTGRRDLTGNIV